MNYLITEALLKNVCSALEIAGVASCTCNTKTGAYTHHKVDCKYRICRGALVDLLVLNPEIGTADFQSRVAPWMQKCFGPEIASDKVERHHRFLEEALELVQSTGCTQSEAHQLVDYVFGRPIGEPVQEVGGVMVTLAALCLSHAMDMHDAGETELARIWTKIEQIRAKQAQKPKHSPLPGAN